MSEQTKKITAWAWRTGLIEFGEVYPEGSLPIITGEEHVVRELIETHSRQSYSGEPLVPGVPEAVDGHEAIEALNRFMVRLDAALNTGSGRLH